MKIGLKKAVFDYFICFETTNHDCRDLVRVSLYYDLNAIVKFRLNFAELGESIF